MLKILNTCVNYVLVPTEQYLKSFRYLFKIIKRKLTISKFLIFNEPIAVYNKVITTAKYDLIKI